MPKEELKANICKGTRAQNSILKRSKEKPRCTPRVSTLLLRRLTPKHLQLPVMTIAC
jgi:hypothetical protein